MGIWLRHDDCLQSISHILNSAVAPVQTVNPNVKSDGRKRARLVAKGFSQVFELDYEETFTLVVQFETVRIILAIAALENLVIQVLDVKTAFLHGKLNEEIYMMQPEGFVIKEQESKVYISLSKLYMDLNFTHLEQGSS